MSNFSFSHSVFKESVLQTSSNQGLFRKGLKAVQPTEIYRALRKNVTKGFSVISPFPTVLSTCLENFLPF